MKKPNYGMERKDRELAKQAKAAAKVEKREFRGDQGRPSEVSSTIDQGSSSSAKGDKSRY